MRTKDTNSDLIRFARNTFASINQRTVNGIYTNRSTKQFNSYHKKGIKTFLEKDSYREFILANGDLIRSIWASGEKASIDRIDDNGDYTLTNIKIIPLKENIHKRGRKRKTSKWYLDALYCSLANRKAYLKNMEGQEIVEKPFDTLLLTLPLAKVYQIAKLSREEVTATLVIAENDTITKKEEK